MSAHGVAHPAPAGSGAQRVRMMEGGFRRWPKELSMQTQGHTQPEGCQGSVHAAGTAPASRAVHALAGQREEGLCPCWLPGPWPQGCGEESTTHTAGDAQVPALGNTE